MRSDAFVTMAALGSASSAVAHDGTVTFTKVKAFARVAVPPGVEIATGFGPAVPVGVIAVAVVALTTTTLVAAAPPMEIPVVPIRFVPVIVIGVPPLDGPFLGLTDVIVGTR